MSKSIDLLNVTYPDVPSIQLPQTGGGTAEFFDVSDTTATAADVKVGTYFYTASGQRTEGTATGGGGSGVVVVDTPDAAGGTIREITAVVLSADTVTAGAMLSGYTAHDASGTAITGNITTKTSSDLVATGDTVSVPAGYYASTASKAVASGTEGTPSASKSITGTTATITPSVTNSAGYISGGTKTGTAVTVTASEVDTLGALAITTNGTASVVGYSSVNVNVSGTSKNVQVVQGTTRTTSSSMTAIGAEMTVSKTGTYDVYWSAFRSSTSGSYTYATQLYIDGSAHGSENATWSNHVQNNHLTSVSLTQNQKLRVYGRESRNSSYYIYAPTLIIVEA